MQDNGIETSCAVSCNQVQRRSFVRRHWLKIVVWAAFLLAFVCGGIAGVGAAAAKAEEPLALSNTEVLVQFIVTGWAFAWRAFIGLSTVVGIFKLGKWMLFQ